MKGYILDDVIGGYGGSRLMMLRMMMMASDVCVHAVLRHKCCLLKLVVFERLHGVINFQFEHR